MIAEYLSKGRKNAQTGRALADLLQCDIRDITAGIEYDRRHGLPIIASCDPQRPGYYLAETAEELKTYCRRLNHRAGEIHKTRRALLETAQALPAEDQRQEAR